MAQPTTKRGTKVQILKGDGGGPEVFSAFCALIAKSFNFQTNTNEFFVPDCADPDAPAWREVVKSGRFLSVSGSGTLAMEDLASYQASYDSDLSDNYQLALDTTDTTYGGHWAGAFMLTNLQIDGNDDGKVQVSISLESDGPVTWVPAT